jgi:hypothetical protein
VVFDDDDVVLLLMWFRKFTTKSTFVFIEVVTLLLPQQLLCVSQTSLVRHYIQSIFTMRLTIATLMAVALAGVEAFSTMPILSKVAFQRSSFSYGLASTRLHVASTIGTDLDKTQSAVQQLKKVLTREYISFFDPMVTEYYSDDVTFEDPMTSLAGVDSYQNNVDMLASRTLLGKILFKDAGIVLHSVSGGEVSPTDGNISNIITRWTLRMTIKAIPWGPTARFSGISVYDVVPGGSEGVQVTHQTDYWDSINIKQGGEYAKVDKGIAVQDFLDQLKPDAGKAAAAGLELPYQLLRRGNGYEVRKYPAYTFAKIPYDRRDEGYDILATVTQGRKVVFIISKWQS